METCRNAVNRFMNALFTLSAIFLGCSTILTFINAVCRRCFAFSFPWSEELATYGIVVGVFLTIPYLEIHDGQLCIGLLSNIIKSQKVLKGFFALRGVVIMALSFVVAKYGIAATQAAITAQTQTYVLRWPKSIFFAVAVGGFCLAIVSWITIFLLNKGDKVEW